MRKVFTWIALILIYSEYVQAVFMLPLCNFECYGGYRHDNLQWSISDRKDRHGGGADRNDKLEGLWKMNFTDLQLWQFGGTYSYSTCNNYYIRLSGDYAQIVSGHSRTRGFTDDGIEYSSIKGKANLGHTYDIEGCVGYTFISNERRFIGTTVVGWAWQYQYLKMHHAEQVLNKPRRLLEEDGISGIGIPKHGRLGDIHGLKVNYDPRWFGPFVGLDWMTIVEPCFIIFGKVEWHFAEQYRADGTWDLSNRELLKFSHHSNGHGLYLTLGGNYRLGNGWFIGVEGEYRNFQASKGRHNTTKHEHTHTHDHLFGRMPLAKKAVLDGAKWNSYSIQLTIDFRYWGDA